MIDGHIHIERGEYTLDWINQFVRRAVEMNLDEIKNFQGHAQILQMSRRNFPSKIWKTEQQKTM